MMVIKFLLGTMMIVSLAWLVAAPGFVPAMILAIAFSGFAAAASTPKEVARMEI
jgi:hypothetical protein